MLTYTVTETGYRILEDGRDWIVQEGEHAGVYPGETMDERAQNHIAALGTHKSAEDRIRELEEALAALAGEGAAV